MTSRSFESSAPGLRPCPFGSPTILERLDFRPLGGRRCITSAELAQEIGFANARYLDRWITERLGLFPEAAPQGITEMVKIGRGTTRKLRTYWLEEEVVIHVILECGTERTEQAQKQVRWHLIEAMKTLNISVLDVVSAISRKG